MPMAIALGVREMRLTPAEAIWAATRAARWRSGATTSACSPPERAHLTVLEAPSYVHLAYRPGVPLVAAVWKDGDPASR